MIQKCKINFILTFSILTIFLGASCTPKSGGSDTTPNNFSADTDGDGVIDGCDTYPKDATDATFSVGCDSDQDGLLEGTCLVCVYNNDGTLKDDDCVNFDADKDGFLSSEEYATIGVNCDNSSVIDAHTYAVNDPDVDGDGVSDYNDDCFLITTNDPDGDCVPTVATADYPTTDNCPEKYNPDQTNGDGDSEGDDCDDTTDADGDGYNVADSDDAKVDCDDTNADVKPGASGDVFGDDVDTDCDGSDFPSDTSNIVWVNPELISSESDADGSFNKPYATFEEAQEVNDVKYIYAYKGSSGTARHEEITEEVTIMGGFTCVTVASDDTESEIEMTTDSDSCTSLSQIRRTKVDIDDLEDDADTIEDYDSLFLGSLTIEVDNVTLDQISVKLAATNSDGTSDDAALIIKNTSPTITHGYFYASADVVDADSQSVAIRIYSSGADVSPTIKENKIVAGSIHDTSDYGKTMVGIQIIGADSVSATISPTITKNMISIGAASIGASGIAMDRGHPNSSETSWPVISKNIITVDNPIKDSTTSTKPVAYGINLVRTAATIEKNKIEVSGTESSSNTARVVIGIFIGGTTAHPTNITDTSKIYTNLIVVNKSTYADLINGIRIRGSTGYAFHAEVYANTLYINNPTTSLYHSSYSSAIFLEVASIDIISNIFASQNSEGGLVISGGITSSGYNFTKLTNNLFDSNFESLFGEYGDRLGYDLESIESYDSSFFIDDNLLDDPNLSSTYKPQGSSVAIDAGYDFYPDRGHWYDSLPSTIPVPEIGSLPSGKVPSGETGGTSTAEFDYSDYLPSLMTDIDGHIRPKGDGVDIGCYEVE